MTLPTARTHTLNGKWLDLLNPTADAMDLREIAWSLANSCRYNGCVRHFYSVAEHSVKMARWAEREGLSPSIRRGMLFHDAHEAYMGDITYPMQIALFEGNPAAAGRYHAIKASLDTEILKLIGQSCDLGANEVREADLRILLTERAVLLNPGKPPLVWDLDTRGLAPLDVEIVGWDPMPAFQIFVDEARILGVTL